MREAFLLFFGKPLNIRGRLTLRGYASRYSRIDILARAVQTASFLKLNGRMRVAGAFPLGEPDHYLLLVYEIDENCRLYNEKEIVHKLLRGLIKHDRDGCVWTDTVELEDTLNIVGRKMTPVRLSEEARDISGSKLYLQAPLLWVLGANVDPPPKVDKLLEERRAPRLSIGPKSYLASHVIAFILWRRNLTYQLRSPGGDIGL
ncbi:MAG: hypothetical protein F7C35_06815 [Desulfurococcales archaeon]|nr:hypothetical protein [Desulfurococcales archaeon]